MTKKIPKTIFVLAIAILLAFSLPASFSKTLRGHLIAVISQGFNAFTKTKMHSEEAEKKLVFQKAQIENDALKMQLKDLYELFWQEKLLSKELMQVFKFSKGEDLKAYEKEKLEGLFFAKQQMVMSKVIYRPPSAWSSSLWINAGQQDNDPEENPVIAKNSPVIAGSSVIGVLDYVGKKQSRVRLITDSGLTPSVRVARGGVYEKRLLEITGELLENMRLLGDAFATKEEQKAFSKQLEKIQEMLLSEKESVFLAKGELHGSSKPLWRSLENKLYGIGFNYDFEDEEGPSRDLRSGKSAGSASNGKKIPLIKVNDLLVTTGMDGVFPAGLSVAKVTKVHLLKEGDYYYEIEAKPTAGNLNELTAVFVLPPLGYDSNDQPPPVGR